MQPRNLLQKLPGWSVDTRPLRNRCHLGSFHNCTDSHMRVRITRPEIFWYVQIMRRLIATCVASFCLLAHPAFAQRLPTGISPTHYTLWFAPDLQQRTFRGRETIDIQVAAPTRAITLNAAEITFSRVTIQAAGRSQEARVALDEKAETATFTVPQPVPAGTASIAITYTGVLNDKLRGFYISNANN